MLEILTALVIATLLILFGIGASAKIRQSGQQVKNVHNLRQIGIATLTYAAEHNYRIPENNGGSVGNTTLGALVSSVSPPRRLFDRNSWTFGTGDQNYLETPDVLFSPFATEYKNREKNDLFRSGNSLYIGYYFYYIPRADENRTASGKGPLHSEIFNDRLTENPRAPLYSDIIYSVAEYPKKFRSDTMNVLFLDGSVKSFDYKTVAALGSAQLWFDYWKTH